MTRKRIFVTRRILDVGLDLLRAAHEVDVWEGELPPAPADLIRRARGCHAILAMITDRFDGPVLDAIGPPLQAIVNYGVGYNNIDLQAMAERRILLGNTPNALTNATADVAVGLMLAAARHFQSGIDDVRRLHWKTWEPLRYLGADLEGATLGIIGFGRIGYATAQRCYGGWGMRILYHARTPKPEYEQTLQARAVPLTTLLQESDFVSLHCDLNPSTYHLIDQSSLARMKTTAVLVNTARGGCVDQTALAEALREGKIAAAGLDVTDPEPIDPDSPLRQLPNCLILPHLGSATWNARSTMATLAAKNVLAALAGQSMPHPVPLPPSL